MCKWITGEIACRLGLARVHVLIYSVSMSTMGGYTGEWGTILFPGQVYERLLRETIKRYPRKTFGYLLSSTPAGSPTDFVLFEDNIRNSRRWQPEFHSYGRYFIDHPDAGFVATPEETWRVQKDIWARGLHEVGVLHSHQRHPANFSLIDWEMHCQRFAGLWHLIISLRNLLSPQVRAFGVAEDGVRELPLRVGNCPGKQSRQNRVTRDAAIARVRRLSRLNGDGRPDLSRAAEIVAVIDTLRGTTGPEVVREVLSDGLQRGSSRRYEDYLRDSMATIPAARFEMGTDAKCAGHFCGESPRHACELSGFRMQRTQVTNELFSLIRPGRDMPQGEAKRPVTGVTWPQASLFALWMGCRLPTEAEWEYSCGAGSGSEWCCESEQQLSGYAWYSANAHDQVRSAGTREPNSLGLCDMHGNVWEWCQDDYDQDFYGRAQPVNPLNLHHGGPPSVGEHPDKVVRGGSMNALSEMCRTRYRIHEPADFSAADLGFRLARDGC